MIYCWWDTVVLDANFKGCRLRIKANNDRFPSSQLEVENFINPAILAMEQVGSRELETEIDNLRLQGQEIIDVFGYPLVSPPDHVRQAVEAASDSTFCPPSNGLLELREGLARVVSSQYETSVDPEGEILITMGAMHALHVVMTALLTPSDEVLLISPCYFFGGLVKIIGARLTYVAMGRSNGYSMDFDKIKTHISPSTRLLVLSSPVNPTGYVYTRADVEQFIELAEEKNLLLVSDESYDRLVYDGLEHVSPFQYPEGRPRTILVKSFTKSYALPTWRVGYIIAPANLLTYFRKVLEWTVLHCPYINQRVALAALEGPQEWLLEVVRTFEQRRNQLLEGISTLKSFSWVRPQGGPFIFLNHASNPKAAGDQFASYLLYHHAIPAVSGRYFKEKNHVRVPFGGTKEAVGKLVTALVETDREEGRR